MNEDNVLGQFIPLHYHFHMLGDEARISAFKQAIHQVVKPDSHVLELGSGTGVLSFFAAQITHNVTAVEYNPALVAASRHFLELNGCGNKVNVLEADAALYLPDQPVDFVICEMLHSALLREQQLHIIHGFKERHVKRFGSVPRFIPEATLMGAQPVLVDYCFQGYVAKVPFFMDAAIESNRLQTMAPLSNYAGIDYSTEFALQFNTELLFRINQNCAINAVRFATRNLLAIAPKQSNSIDWYNQHLIAPLRSTVLASLGDEIKIIFDYKAGGSIDSLVQSLRCEVAV